MKKFIALLLTLALVLSLSAMSVMAIAFPDVTSPQYDWAKKEIEDMVAKGFIKGYPDSTFRPAQAITKIEALILSARILGYTDADNKDFVALATELYEKVLEDYDFDYKGEVSYLLYKGILSRADLEDYIAEDVINTPLTRYEAAVILTLICGTESELSDDVPDLEFTDADKAPNWALPYIEYVYNTGLMKGVSDKAFDPMGSVTRAQISVMLHRAMDTLDLSIEIGTVSDVDADKNLLVIEDANGDENEIKLANGVDIVIAGEHGKDLSFVYPTSTVAIIRFGKTITAVEAIVPEVETVVASGTIVSVPNSLPGKMRVKIDGETYIFDVPASVTVKIDGETKSFSKLEKDQFVKCTVVGDAIVSIDAEGLNNVITGTVSAISYDPVLMFTITDDDDESRSYAADEDVTVKRNGKESNLRAVVVGDEVRVVLRGNMMYSVTATGEKTSVTGTIVGIHISTTPTIDIKTEDGVVSYALNQNTSYKLDTNSATIYDLRLNATVKLSLDSDTVVSVTTTSVSSDIVVTGVITDTNSSYNFVNVQAENGDSYQVFLSKSTTIIDGASGSSIRVSDLKKNEKITVFGAYNTGVIEATTVVVS